LQAHIVRNEAVLNEASAEIELDLRGGGKPDFDLFETDPHKHFKILDFFFHAHRLGECLIAIAEIHAAPLRGVSEDAPWPLSVGEVNHGKWPVF
jgi:hypothetical protein